VDLLLRKSARTYRADTRSRNGPGLLLVADRAQQKIVARCCPVARAAGVVPGMNLAEARALGPVNVSPFDAQRSRQALELLAKWCLRFSPVVSVDQTPSGNYPDEGLDGVLLNVTGEAHLFGSEHLLLAEIDTALRRMGFAARMAIAPTVGAAWAVARFGAHAASVVGEEHVQTALMPLPVRALRLPAALCAALREVGIEQVWHLLKLPRESLLTRYGEEVLVRLDQAMGRMDELITPIHPTEPVSVSRVFDGPAIQIEAIVLTVQGLLGTLSRRLLERESGVRGLRLELLRINAPPVSREVIIGRASRDEKHLWRLLQSKVEKMHMGYGVEAVRMTAFWTEAIRHQQLGAWETGEGDAHDEAFDALLDTLIDRWGEKRVLRAGPKASHTPEVARQFEPARAIENGAESGAGIVAAVDRPSILFERPEPAEAVALQPDRPPSFLKWRGEGHTLRCGQGPERIVTAWWGTQRASTRDYFKVQFAGGWWVWVFRELETGRWFIHGIWG